MTKFTGIYLLLIGAALGVLLAADDGRPLLTVGVLLALALVLDILNDVVAYARR